MGMSDRETKIMKVMKESQANDEGCLSSSTISRRAGITRTETIRGLNGLIIEGKIERRGTGNSTGYIIPEAQEKLRKKRVKDLNEGLKDLIEKNGLDKKIVGRPKKDPQDVKQKRHVRVSDADMELIQEHGFTVQTILDQAIESLKPVDVEDMKLKLSTLKSAFPKEGI
jgi:hypothetical protein